MSSFSIDGKFLTQTLTGTQRYASEIVRELDQLCAPDEFELVVPVGSAIKSDSEFHRIPIVRYGEHSGPYWTHRDFARRCSDRDSVPLCLNNIAPLLSKSAVTIHDVSPRANKGFYGWKYRIYQDICLNFNIRNASIIFTVSHFSKGEIEKYYPGSMGKIEVIPCAWQHMERLKADTAALVKYGLRRGDYWFAMSSLTPNKNLRWIAETARLNQGEHFVVAGGINAKTFGQHDIPTAENVDYLGYVSDAEAKALMAGCKGFLFPTFYEGFGMPPMEAMASGAPVCVVGDNPCMHEVYRDSVAYVDPYVPCPDLAALAGVSTETPDAVLSRFSWRKSASRMLEALRRMA